MSGTVSGSTGRRILVLGGRIVLNLGAGITRVSAGSVVCSTAGGGKGMAFCSCGSCECGLAGSLVVKMYIILSCSNSPGVDCILPQGGVF